MAVQCLSMILEGQILFSPCLVLLALLTSSYLIFVLLYLPRMGFSYSKRKNMVELAVLRGCTARPDSIAGLSNRNPDPEKRECDVGWPGMMSIWVHELDGMYDHPILPMAGDAWQLLEIQCHSKLAAKRLQNPKKGSKPDGSDDNGDYVPALDVRSKYVNLNIFNEFLQ